MIHVSSGNNNDNTIHVTSTKSENIVEINNTKTKLYSDLAQKYALLAEKSEKEVQKLLEQEEFITIKNSLANIQTVAQKIEIIKFLANHINTGDNIIFNDNINNIAQNIDSIISVAENINDICNSHNYYINAKKYAVGIPEEPDEFSAKHWANIASQNYDSINQNLDNKQDKLTAGTGIEITANNVINNTQTSAEWGNIEGNICNQQDLIQTFAMADELNNPWVFGMSIYSPIEFENVSWLKSYGQWNSKSVYVDYYNWILQNANNSKQFFMKTTSNSTEIERTIIGNDWSNVLKSFDGNTSTYSSPTSGAAYIEVEYSTPVTILSYSATGIYVSGAARNVNIDMYTVDNEGNETLVGVGQGSTNSTPYTTGVVFDEPIIASKIRFKTSFDSSDAPPRYTSISINVDSDSDKYWVVNTTDETFRLPIKTNLASGNAVVGNGKALALTDGVKDYGLVSGTVSTTTGTLRATTSTYNVNVGSSYNVTSTPSSVVLGLQTNPDKSGMKLSSNGLYLYFYVGETVQNANLIDAGRIAEQLANKLDTTPRFIIEKSDKSLLPSWYNIYNDGWVEQGGIVVGDGSNGGVKTVSLLIPYANTNYCILATSNAWDDSSFNSTSGANARGIANNVGVGSKTTSSFHCGSATTKSWVAYGYKESSPDRDDYNGSRG